MPIKDTIPAPPPPEPHHEPPDHPLRIPVICELCDRMHGDHDPACPFAQGAIDP